MDIFVVSFGHVALDGAVLTQQVEGVDFNFAALAGQDFLAQAGIPKQVLLVVAGRKARVSLVHEVGLEVDARPHNPAQPQARDLREVVGIEPLLQRVAHKILG